jgi:hypothetical protein
MKKTTPRRSKNKDGDQEYDFAKATVGKYAARYRQGSNVVVLDPDVQKAFPDSQHVNDALRALIDVAKRI